MNGIGGFIMMKSSIAMGGTAQPSSQFYRHSLVPTLAVVDDKGHRHSSVNSSCAVDFAGSPCEIAGALIPNLQLPHQCIPSDWLLNIVTMPLGGDSDIQKVAENELTRAEDLCVLKLFACLEANTGVPFQHCELLLKHKFAF